MTRNPKYLVGALLVLLCAGANDSFAADQTAMFEARYAAMKSAMAARDSKAILALLTPDFSSVDVTGQTENGQQMVSEVTALHQDPNKTSETTVLSVKPDEPKAIIAQRYDMKTVKQAADGTKKNVELITLSTDTWLRSNGTWLLQRTETKQMDYFVDGTQVAHKTSAAP